MNLGNLSSSRTRIAQIQIFLEKIAGRSSWKSEILWGLAARI